MNIENLKTVEKLTERRSKVIDLRGAAQASSNVRIMLEIGGTMRYADDVLPPAMVRAAVFEESTNEINGKKEKVE